MMKKAIKFATTGSLLVSTYVAAEIPPSCQFLPQEPAPEWVNKDVRDNDFYYAVGGASGQTANGFLDINDLITQARDDAIQNLSRSIRSAIKVSTKRTIESQKTGKSKAEIRKEVEQKSELVSQTALSAVMDDARWLDQENCLLWYRVKVSKQGAEFAIKSYVNQVEQRLTKRIDELTKREIEQILSDNGFTPTSADATRALLNDSSAIYRGQKYSIADLYQQSGFDWLEEQQDYTFGIRWYNNLFTNGASSLNVPISIIASGSSSEKIVNALVKLQSYGIDLNKVIINLGEQYNKVAPFAEKGQYNYLNPAPYMLNTIVPPILPPESDIFVEFSLDYKVKTPMLYNFATVSGKEQFGLIHVLTLEHRIDLVEPLKSIGIELDKTSTHGYTALALAIELDNLDLADELINQGAKVSTNNHIAYKIAFLKSHLNRYASEQTAHRLPVSLKRLKEYDHLISQKQKTTLIKNIESMAPLTMKMSKSVDTSDGTKTNIKTFINGDLVSDVTQ